MQCSSCGVEVPEGTPRCPSCFELLREEPSSGSEIVLPPRQAGRRWTAHEALAWLAFACSGAGLLVLGWMLLNTSLLHTRWDATELWLTPLVGPVGIFLGGLSLALGRHAECGRWRVAALVGLWIGIALVITVVVFVGWLLCAWLGYVLNG